MHFSIYSKAQFVALLVALICAPVMAYAHVVLSSSTVTAVMHAEPNDEPTEKTKSVLSFEFRDQVGQHFTENECDCVVTVMQDGKEIQKKELIFLDTPHIHAEQEVVFPEQGVYVVSVSGKPVSENAFTAFQMQTSVRVDKAGEVPTTAMTGMAHMHNDRFHIIEYGLFGIAFLIIGGLFINEKRKEIFTPIKKIS